MKEPQYKKTRYWTRERDAYLIDNYSQKNIDSLAEHFGKSRHAIMARASKLGVKSGRYLTDEQRLYIEEHPELSNQYLQKKLKADNVAIRHYRYKYSVPLKDGSETKLTCAEVGRLVGKDKSTIAKCWCGKGGLKSKVVGKRYKFIKINDLLEWMQDNPKRWDATKCDTYFFQSYDWFSKKRKQDFDKMVDKKWGAVIGKEKNIS